MLEIGKELGIKKESEIEKINFETLSHKIPTKPYVIEINLSELIEKIKDKSIDNVFLDLDTSKIENVKYKSFSQMPFVVRDVAFWCDIDTDKFEILDLIKNNAGQLCVSVNIFDQFTKEIEMKDKGGNILGKRVSQSLGYRLVYQDKHSTLTDNQVNVYVENVYSVLKEKDFTIR